MTLLDKKLAFFHVINDHRWLAASGCAWRSIRALKQGSGEQKQLDALLPNVCVAIQASLLSHSRSLIDFYTKTNGRKTDIRVGDFIAFSPCNARFLKNYGKSIELHLLHLTEYRDDQFRAKNQIAGNLLSARADWNSENPLIVERLLECLKSVSEVTNGLWPKAFKQLHEACVKRYGDRFYQWPKELCEKPDVVQYLKSLGL